MRRPDRCLDHRGFQRGWRSGETLTIWARQSERDLKVFLRKLAVAAAVLATIAVVAPVAAAAAAAAAAAPVATGRHHHQPSRSRTSPTVTLYRNGEEQEAGLHVASSCIPFCDVGRQRAERISDLRPFREKEAFHLWL